MERHNISVNGNIVLIHMLCTQDFMQFHYTCYFIRHLFNYATYLFKKNVAYKTYLYTGEDLLQLTYELVVAVWKLEPMP